MPILRDAQRVKSRQQCERPGPAVRVGIRAPPHDVSAGIAGGADYLRRRDLTHPALAAVVL